MYRRIILINRVVVLRCCSPPFPSTPNRRSHCLGRRPPASRGGEREDQLHLRGERETIGVSGLRLPFGHVKRLLVEVHNWVLVVS